MKKVVLAIVGPTAVGKSSIAMKVAAALNGEIISADSMQIYRGMSIGTAKPDAAVLQSVPHHLIDIRDPSEEFSVFDFYREAVSAVESVLNRSKLPILCGGTGLYVRSLIHGLIPGRGKSEQVKARLKSESDQLGVECMYKRLQELDFERSIEMASTDERRILRALEIIEIEKNSLKDPRDLCPGLLKLGYQVVLAGVSMDRSRLYERINQRVDDMIAQGLWREAEALYKTTRSKTSSQAVGYKEIYQFLSGRQSSKSSTVELIKQKSRNLAKRQMTWFRKEKNVQWLADMTHDSEDQAVRNVLNSIKPHIQ